MIEHINEIIWHTDLELRQEIRTGVKEWVCFCTVGGNHMMRLDEVTQWKQTEQGEKDGEGVLEVTVFVRQLEDEVSMKAFGI